MSFFQDESMLTARFQSEFTGWPNIPIDYVATKSEPVNGKIIRFRIARAFTKNSGVGNGRARNYGNVQAQIELPSGEGSGDMNSIADDIARIFRNYRNGGLKCLQPSLSTVREVGSLITSTVDVPFYFDYNVT